MTLPSVSTTKKYSLYEVMVHWFLQTFKMRGKTDDTSQSSHSSNIISNFGSLRVALFHLLVILVVIF